MTEIEQKTLAIAKWHGFHQIKYVWTDVAREEPIGLPPNEEILFVPYEKDENYFYLPDYFRDLNVINRLVSKLNERDLAVYGDCLNVIVGAFEDDYYNGWGANYTMNSFAHAIAAVSQATAEQKCNALIQALKLKWIKN